MSACECFGDRSQVLSPRESMSLPREKVIYVLCLQPEENQATKAGYLATVDADPESKDYGKVIHRLYSSDPRDELHHFGWNSCVSCRHPAIKRRFLIVPGLASGNLHIVDVIDPRAPAMHKVIEGAAIRERFNIAYPHTVHCLPSGEVMISYMGDTQDKARGAFLLLDGLTFEPQGLWNKGHDDTKIMGYDYWYQPRHNIMISSEFGHPSSFMKGFNIEDAKPARDLLGHSLNFFDWHQQTLIKSIRLGNADDINAIPLEVRFLHDPAACEGFVGAALQSVVYRFFKKDGEWATEPVIKVPAKHVENWSLPVMPGLITDILISLDDKFLYFANWLHGDVRQYDISDTHHPKLVSSVFFGGLICSDTGIKVTKDEELDAQPARLVVKGHPIWAGPNMLQMSRDGRRLYVTSSLLTPWDKQFYPQMVKKGSGIVLLNCTPQGMTVDPDFYVDLASEPDGAIRGHEVRYPGGDCTSDIWI
ncbi:methanethiol oxidase-like [Paramacrobiotus metropolitanus]|uniref:methanethiol oxidase-like n=1 Tax=Paramacrobiotus metropolitanus TaxID=2943436 RepID=UPI002445DE09|nr:methanethiol oxidase-like [Paramacrobiotus metropolitanus]